jgi:hypothetical protein
VVRFDVALTNRPITFLKVELTGLATIPADALDSVRPRALDPAVVSVSPELYDRVSSVPGPVLGALGLWSGVQSATKCQREVDPDHFAEVGRQIVLTGKSVSSVHAPESMASLIVPGQDLF